MSIIKEIISPIIQLIIYIGLGGWSIFLIHKGFKKVFPDLKWIIKYKISRKKYNEEDVEGCMDAVERNMEEVEIKKFLLVHKQDPNKVAELLYIIKQIQKEIHNQKGGVKNE